MHWEFWADRGDCVLVFAEYSTGVQVSDTTKLNKELKAGNKYYMQ